MKDNKLDDLLNEAVTRITPERIHRVRTRVLVAAHTSPRQSPFAALFGFRPAVLLATGLLGLFLGASLPTIGLDNGTAAFLDNTQGFLTGDYG